MLVYPPETLSGTHAYWGQIKDDRIERLYGATWSDHNIGALHTSRAQPCMMDRLSIVHCCFLRDMRLSTRSACFLRRQRWCGQAPGPCSIQ